MTTRTITSHHNLEAITSQFNLDESLIARIASFCSGPRAGTGVAPEEIKEKEALVAAVKNITADIPTEELKQVAKDYGLTVDELVFRAVLDTHVATYCVIPHSLNLVTSSAAWELSAAIREYTPDQTVEKLPSPEWMPEGLSNIEVTIDFIANEIPTLEEKVKDELKVSYDLIDFDHRSKGRWDAYHYCIFYRLLKNAGLSVAPRKTIFLGSEAMIDKRITHARRVYRSIRLDKEDNKVKRTVDISWFSSIFTSDNAEAMEDILQEIENEIWHLSFFRSEQDVPQYHEMFRDRSDISQLLVALLGHPLDDIRDRAVVLLNIYFDDHEWQAHFPLLSIQSNVGDDLTVTFRVEVPAGASYAKNLDGSEGPEAPEEAPPTGYFLQLVAPAADPTLRTEHGFLSYHHVENWRKFGDVRGSAVWEGSVSLGSFTRCGFYDWRVHRTDSELGSWEVAVLSSNVEPAILANTPWVSRNRGDADVCSSSFKLASRMTGAPVQGRFICQKAPSDNPILEYALSTIGDEKSAAPLVDVIMSNEGSEQPFDAVCLRGVNADLRSRSPPNLFQGGELAQSLRDVGAAAKQTGVDVCVETTFRVSTTLRDRKYDAVSLHVMDGGRLCEAYGAHGLAKDLTDATHLNFRDVRAWTMYRDECREWLDSGMVTGVVVEGLGMGCLFFAIDGDEMGRIDTDGQRHYTDAEILTGKVVLPMVIEARSGALDTFPDPFVTYLCRSIWANNPYARILGETVITDATDFISRSGAVPYVRSMLPIISNALGKPAPDASILKAEWNLWRSSTPTIDVLHRVVSNMTNKTIPNGIAYVSTVSPGALCAYSHLESLAWAYVGWLTIVPVQQSFTYVEKFNKCPADYPEDRKYFMPYIVRESKQDFTPRSIANANQRARSFIGSIKNKAQNPHSPTARSSRRASMIASTREMPQKGWSLLQMGTQKSEIMDQVSKSVALQQDANKLSLPADKLTGLANVGFDTSKFAEHIESCVTRGRVLREMLYEGLDAKVTNELYFPLKAKSAPTVLCFARVVNNGSFAICVVNFGTEPSAASISLQPLHQLVISFNVDRHSNYVVQECTDMGPQAIDMCTLLESVNGSIEFTLQPGDVSFRVYSIQPERMEMPKRELYRFAFHRLVQGAREAQICIRRNDQDAKLAVARALNSNALIMDLINALQERGNANMMAKYLREVSLVIGDLYQDSESGYSKFLGTLLDLGIFSTNASLPLDAALQTGTKTSLSKAYSNKVCSIAAAEADPALAPASDLAKVLSRANGVGPLVFCTSEYGKFSTVGGLGVMVDELASTLVKAYDQEVWVISPYYHRNAKGRENHFDELEYMGNVGVQVGPDYMEFGLHYCLYKGVKSFFIHHEGIYPCPYPDNRGEAQLRFLTFTSKAMLETICWAVGNRGLQLPELVISNDWPTGLVPAHARAAFGDTYKGTTFYHIVHNLNPDYEGRVWCDRDLYHIHGLNTELLVDPSWRAKVFNPSRCALLSADAWGTVSPSYRNELLGIGCQSASPLQPVLARNPDSFATPNGVPIEEREEFIIKKMKSIEILDEEFQVKTPNDWIEIHYKAKDYIQNRYFGFEVPDRDIPLCAFVGRITSQKGVHLICQGAEQLIKRYNYRIQFLIGGMVNWSDPYSAGCGRTMIELRNKYPYCFWCGPDEFFYDGAIINVGTDIALMPSAFEPGGIVQHEMFAGGTPVLAFKTGGLRDTVHEFQPETNTGSGWTFESFNLGDYLYACERAVRTVSDSTRYHKLRINAKNACISSTEVSGKWLAEFTRLRRKFNVPVIASENVTPFDLKAFKTWTEENHKEEEESEEPKPDTPKKAAPKPAVRSTTMSPKMIQPTAKVRYTPAEGRPRNVAVCGGWSDWTVRHPMFWDNATGSFTASFPCKRGSWPYKIICDGNWQLNDGEETCLDEGGNANSVLYV